MPFRPSHLTVFDYNENSLTELTRDLRSHLNEFIPKSFSLYPIDFGSSIFHKYFERNSFDIVASFAAHKHVRSEKDTYSIEAMFRNNVVNTKNLLDLCIKNSPEHLFCVSTDKAANPVNLMGATKKLMEHVIFSYSDQLKISTARFANVAFSNGSLLDGFLYRMQKRQPIVAPRDVRRYFVSPQESGQLCLLASVLGDSADVFFPKMKESMMTTFNQIATDFLNHLGYEPRLCETEEEARERMKTFKENSVEYPVLFFDSDTSGEKPFEEFFTASDKVDLQSYKSLGVIKNMVIQKRDISSMIHEFGKLFAQENLTKSQIVDLFSRHIEDLNHLETGKSLDSKM